MEQKKAQTNVQIDKLDNILSLSFNCDLDAHIVRHLRHDIDTQTDDETRHFLVDMSRVSFLDSHGIGLFASLLKKAHARHGYLAFIGVNGQPASVLHMVGFNETLVKYHDTKSSAIEAINKTCTIHV